MHSPIKQAFVTCNAREKGYTGIGQPLTGVKKMHVSFMLLEIELMT
jgi:hypothetical protein